MPIRCTACKKSNLDVNEDWKRFDSYRYPGERINVCPQCWEAVGWVFDDTDENLTERLIEIEHKNRVGEDASENEKYILSKFITSYQLRVNPWWTI